jgi:hypothetical protein
MWAGLMNSFNFNVWYESYDPNFIDINKKSLVPEKWLSYQKISHHKFANSILKPINKYVETLYPAPELVSIINNQVTLRQKTHAGIFLLDDYGSFYNVDRPHMRQYYQTKINYETKSDCFDPAYVFYIPWAIDADVDVKIEQSDLDSPFEIKEALVSYKNIDQSIWYLEPNFVAFKFKKTGTHMVNKDFGKIKPGAPMFNMTFILSDILIERMREFYENN